jgi:hypothetical protein
MKEINKSIQSYLKSHGINAMPMYITKGSMKGMVRLYQRSKNKNINPEMDGFIQWTEKQKQTLQSIGFKIVFDGICMFTTIDLSVVIRHS